MENLQTLENNIFLLSSQTKLSKKDKKVLFKMEFALNAILQYKCGLLTFQESTLKLLLFKDFNSIELAEYLNILHYCN